jgi:hypothetical protein
MGEPEDGTRALGSEGEVALEEVSPARRLGEAMFLTVVPGGLAVTRSSEFTAEVRGLAECDDVATPADDPDLVALAAAASGIEAAAGVDDLCAQALPGVPDATATGIADDGGPVILVAHAYAAGDAAQEAADRLEELVSEGSSLANRSEWSELLTVDDVSVTGPDGTVAIARLRPTEEGHAGLWRDLVLARDVLVAGCDG